MPKARYKADIAGGSLKVSESRVIAALLLDGVNGQNWHDAIVVRNVLQKRSPGTAKRQASLIRARLVTMERDLWILIRDGTNPVATHAVLAAAIKHSTLLGDFLDLVVREEVRLFRPNLNRKLWADFLDQCRGRDPIMPEWRESTADKLGETVFRILGEAGYIIDARSRALKPVRIAGEVLSYLRNHEENYVLRCIQVGQ